VKRVSSQPAAPAWRLHLVALGLSALLLLLLGRVLSLQILDVERGREFLQDQGEMRAVRTAEIPAYRGVITDRRGEPLAVSTPVVSLWADPRLLAASGRVGELAQALDIEVSELREKLSRYAGKRFMYLQRHRIPAEARDVLELDIEGVYGEREYRRFYPAGEVAAQLVGFTNLDGEGIAGLELAYNDWLRGMPGRKQYIKDLHGEVARDIGVLEPARPGRDLSLSIDLRLQYLQHRELSRAVIALGAESGSVVTLDSRTGEVLAMVNYPVFNPNSREAADPAGMRNRAMTDHYEPGSTMKALTLVAALESGRYTPRTPIDTAPGYVRVGQKTYPDPRNYGEITLTEVIQKSSQVGVTKIALDIGHEPIRDVFERFGIGRPPGTGFPGESGGQLPHRQRWATSEKVSLAFGYGITATPLQLARAYAVFANGGLRIPVSLLALEGYAKATVLTFVVPILALAVPLIDTGLSIIRRMITRRPIFDPDKQHIHHRMLATSGTHRDAVLSIYFLTACFCVIAVSFTRLDGPAAILFLGLVVILTVRLMRNLGFLTNEDPETS